MGKDDEKKDEESKDVKEDEKKEEKKEEEAKEPEAAPMDEEEEEPEDAKVDFDGLDVFGVEDVTDVGGSMPLFKDFTFDDWTLMTLRFELHLLTHAFRRDVDDPERLGIHMDHINFYYNKYFSKGINPSQYGVESFKDLVGLVWDALNITHQQVLESKLADEMEHLGIFVKLTEEERRERLVRIDMGEESAKLKFNLGGHKGGGKWDNNKGGVKDKYGQGSWNQGKDYGAKGGAKGGKDFGKNNFGAKGGGNFAGGKDSGGKGNTVGQQQQGQQQNQGQWGQQQPQQNQNQWGQQGQQQQGQSNNQWGQQQQGQKGSGDQWGQQQGQKGGDQWGQQKGQKGGDQWGQKAGCIRQGTQSQ